MPFIDSKVSVKLTKEQEETIKAKLGQAITVVPGKSEAWLMVGFEDEYSLYFKGQRPERAAFVEIKLFGKADAAAYNKLTAAVCGIYNEVLGIPEDKIYVKYEEASHWGWNGCNF